MRTTCATRQPFADGCKQVERNVVITQWDWADPKARRRAGTEGQQTVYAAPVPVPLREARRRWAELLRRIFEVEPLECPRCGQTMRIVAFITEPQVIDRILDHLHRTATARCRSRAPPRAARRPRAAAGSTST